MRFLKGAEGEGFEPSRDETAPNGFRDLLYFAQPCGLRPGARQNARQSCAAHCRRCCASGLALDPALVAEPSSPGGSKYHANRPLCGRYAGCARDPKKPAEVSAQTGNKDAYLQAVFYGSDGGRSVDLHLTRLRSDDVSLAHRAPCPRSSPRPLGVARRTGDRAGLSSSASISRAFFT
jgi:hypothetical protein